MPQYAAAINLASLNGTNGITFTASSSVSSLSVGDINGDGILDLIIGQYSPGAGTTYVVFGHTGSWSTNTALSALNGVTGFAVTGEVSGDLFGVDLSSGDFDGDGFDDLLIGAQFTDFSASNAGSVYVIFGAASGWSATQSVTTLTGANGFRTDGLAANDRFGVSVSTIGDFNGDGFDDFVIGADNADPNGASSGQAFVVFGAESGWPADFDLTTLNGTNGFRVDGLAADDYLGARVSDIGDINDDGYADLAINAFRADFGATVNSGETYVIFGSASGWGATFDVTTLNGAYGFLVYSNVANTLSGVGITNAGDINADGIDDLIVGAHGATVGGDLNAGQTFVVYGRTSGWAASLDLASINGVNGFRIDGIDAGDISGLTTAAGDINGDGFADLVISADEGDPLGVSSAGEVYVVFGGANLSAVIDLSTLDGNNGYVIQGIAENNQIGSYITVGDINGDGLDDVVVGGALSTAYVVWGARPGEAVTRTGTATDNHIFGGAFGDTLNGLEGDDILDGGDGADTLNGGDGNDIIHLNYWAPDPGEIINGGDGIDTIRMTAEWTFQDYDLRNTTISSIERLEFAPTAGSWATVYISASQVGAGLSASLQIVGSSLRDTIDLTMASAGVLDISGFDFVGWSTADLVYIYGSTGDDTITSTDVFATIYGGNGADTLIGGDAVNWLYGEGGNDTITGGAANDALSGGGDDDTINGGAGDDSLYGGLGQDALAGGDGRDYLSGDAGNDTINGGAGIDGALHGSISSTAASWTRSLDGSWTVTSAHGVDTLTNVEFLHFGDRAVFLDRAATNFSGDGASDILLRNGNGVTAIWSMNGATVTNSDVTQWQAAPAWTLNHVADFNNDGRDDFLLRRDSDGVTAIWFMNGTSVQSADVTQWQAGLDWSIQGVGDFNLDGVDDIVWRRATDGVTAIWSMDGVTVASADVTTWQTGNDWSIQHIGDFNGDGRDDFLWRRDDGVTTIWHMDGAAVIDSNVTTQQAGNEWAMAGVGDFDGDGRDDILLRRDDGVTAIWTMNGTTVANASVTSELLLGANWQVAALGDYNGDGRSDILWQSNNGALLVWTMDGAQVTSATETSQFAGADWTII